MTKPNEKPLPGVLSNATGTVRPDPAAAPDSAKPPAPTPPLAANKVPEIGGPAGPEPTRYGDWERKGRCIDF